MAVVINDFETVIEPPAPATGSTPAPAAAAAPLTHEDLRRLLADMQEVQLRLLAH
jgi:hypothetical protein